MWHCHNLVCGPEGHASGVLLRAGEIRVGAESARRRRLSARNDRELAKGPARLADQVRSGPRTGVGGDGAPHPWCFWIHEDPTVSPYRAHVPRKRPS